ncbi:MAG: DNA cytosine methyltransferase [Desulfurellales bacterium]|nr:MAG: DNA cytosine methyltransferase [Desulfurellales bacterium]
MRIYYNEIDDYCCDWLSNLMDAGAITPGVIDNRSIEDIRPSDLAGFDRVHFFAGIGVWEYAILQSGLGAYAGIWTGSCPCQPFSAAGKGDGFEDERHLWPAFFHLIEECSPSAVLGEQVASKDGLSWLDLVSADLEAANYAFGAGDICAAGFGAPHIRQRLYWAAFGLEHTSRDGLQGRISWRKNPQWETVDRSLGRDGAVGLLDNANISRTTDSVFAGRKIERSAGATGGLSDDFSQRRFRGQNAERPACKEASERSQSSRQLERSSQLVQLSDSTYGSGQPEEPRTVERFLPQGDGTVSAFSGGTGPTNGFWRFADWLACRDGKWRPVEPGTFPLAHGASARVGRLRAYGNAIVAPQAIEFCESVREFIETIDGDI